MMETEICTSYFSKDGKCSKEEVMTNLFWVRVKQENERILKVKRVATERVKQKLHVLEERMEKVRDLKCKFMNVIEEIEGSTAS